MQQPLNPNLAPYQSALLVSGKDKPEEVLLHTKTEDSHAYQNLPWNIIINAGGRHKKDIPIRLIHKLSKKGLSISQIVGALKRGNHSISAMTVSRVLSGERQ